MKIFTTKWLLGTLWCASRRVVRITASRGVVPVSDRSVVIGAGHLGSAFAERISSVRPVTVVESSSAARADCVTRLGVQGVEKIAHVDWDEVDHAHVVVRTAMQASEVLGEIDEVASSSLGCHVHTTLSVPAAQRLSATAFAKIRFLEQPITGGVEHVRQGTAVVLTTTDLTRTDREYLETIIGRLIEFRDAGAPSLSKLINNVAAAVAAVTTTKLLRTAHDHGIDLVALREVLDHGSGGSWMASALPTLDPDQAQLLFKDVRLLEESLGDSVTVDLADEQAFVIGLRRLQSHLIDPH